MVTMTLKKPADRERAGTPQEESDEGLMVRVMEGERAAFDELYERYVGRIRTFVYRFVGNREAAEDVSQDIFLKVYRNPRAFDPRKRFLTWIFAVSRNACIDFLRLTKLPTIPVGGGDAEEGTWGLEPETIPSASPVQAAIGHELEGRMQEVLETLSPKLREVFVLCVIQGLSYEQAAEIVDVPVKTVSSRLSRARDKFYDEFKKYLDTGGPRSGLN